MIDNLLIEVQDIYKNFDKVEVLKGVSIGFEKEKQYVIKGASGSGKSTLLYLMGGLDKATDGQIIVDGNDLGKLSDEKLAQYRNSFVGFVFQFHFLLPTMNCLNNILLPAQIGGANVDEIREDVYILTQRLGVEHCLKKFPYQISGGEQQRINIVRALSLRPAVLLCDEPTGNLDSKNSEIVVELLTEMAGQFGSTLVVVTHDEIVASHFKHPLVMEDGKLT